jgi:hypothetical protein
MKEFWFKHVMEKKEPDPTEWGHVIGFVQKKFPKENDVMLESSAEIEDLAKRYIAVKKVINNAENERAEIVGKICIHIGANKGVKTSQGKFTFATQRGRASYAKLIKDLKIPDAEVDKYRSAPTRVFRPFLKDEEE